MNNSELFCHLSSGRIAELIRTTEGAVCYAGPGIQQEPAKAMVEVANRIGPELITVSLDFDERVIPTASAPTALRPPAGPRRDGPGPGWPPPGFDAAAHGYKTRSRL